MKMKRNISYPDISREQAKEFGMLTVLVMSFLAFYLRQNNLSVFIFILALLTLLFPLIFYPFAIVWFALSKLLGKNQYWYFTGSRIFCHRDPSRTVSKYAASGRSEIKTV